MASVISRRENFRGRKTKAFMFTNKPSQVWQPTVPSWEKRFLKEVGLFEWKDFADAKRFIHVDHNIMLWNDFAAKEAFHNAKTRFKAKQIDKLPCDLQEPDPNMYTDEVDWNSVIDPDLVFNLVAGDDVDPNEEEDENPNMEIVIEDIKPTGWDVADQDIWKPNVLSGLLVGTD